MTTRTWVNDGGIALSAANLNSLEADVQKGLDASSAISNFVVNEWRPSTVYALNRYVLDPSGTTVKVTTAHTSTSTYDATKFTAVASVVGDATVAGYVNTLGSATNTAVNNCIAGATRTNLVTNPSFEAGTSGVADGTNSTFATSTTQKFVGAQSLAITRSNTTTGSCYARIQFNVTAGLTYTVSAYVYGGAGAANTYTFRAGGAASSPTINFTPSNSWQRLSATGTATSTGVGYLYVTDDLNTAPAAGTIFYVDAVLVEQSATLGAYFDGGMSGTATTINQWSGAPHASTSTQRVVSSAVKPLMSRTGTPPIGQGEFYVSVADYLDTNRVVGTTDDLPAFTAALGTGAFGPVRVFVPAGEYWISSAILLPSYSELFGAGMDISIIRLLASAPNDTWVVTNSTPTAGGNTNIRVHDLTLDWRWSATRTGGAGGTRSSCLTLRAVQYAWIDRVKSINSGLHAFDVAQGSIDYVYTGDGTAEPSDPSRYVWIRNCIGTAWGDDGITTHHSEYIWLENNFMYDPRERTNCNGIEIDDGSRHVFLAANMTAGCYGGVELKAHNTASAASDVHINGHFDNGSTRSYNFRHIGHHSGTDPVSLTAFDITCSNLVSINANNDKGFQDDTTPRALCISAYHRVSINGFTAVGRGGYASGDVAVAIQYRSGHINLSGINITGWGGADQDISITSGDNISVSGLNIQNSAKRAIYTGNAVTAVQIWGVNATAPASGSLYGVDLYDSTGVELSGVAVQGYPTPIRADLTNYQSLAVYYRRAVAIPAGVTNMKALDPSKDYYADNSIFPSFGTDRPAPAASAGGAYFIQHSRLSSDSVIQSITRNTTSTSQAHYWRVLNWVTQTAGAWNQSTITAVAYSAT